MLMKILGGIGSLTANVFVILHQNNIEDVIKDFIAVGVINEIDDIVAGTWTYYDVQELVRETEIWIEKARYSLTDSEIIALYSEGVPEDPKLAKLQRTERQLGLATKLSCYKLGALRIWMFVYRFLMFWMNVVQFYFAPFVVTFLLIIKASPMDVSAWAAEANAD